MPIKCASLEHVFIMIERSSYRLEYLARMGEIRSGSMSTENVGRTSLQFLQTCRKCEISFQCSIPMILNVRSSGSCSSVNASTSIHSVKKVPNSKQHCAVLFCCAVIHCAVLCCAVLCCAVLCCAVLYCEVLCCAVQFL